MALSVAARNLMLEALADVAVFASLHTADPGATGTSEVTGGTPVYARIAVTWDPATGGVLAIDTGAPPEFDVPSGITVRFGGLWSASTGGTWYGGAAVTNVAFTGQGTYRLNTITVTLP